MKTLGDRIKEIQYNDLIRITINNKFWILNVSKGSINGNNNYTYIKNYFSLIIDKEEVIFDKKGRKICHFFVTSKSLEEYALKKEDAWYDSKMQAGF